MGATKSKAREIGEMCLLLAQMEVPSVCRLTWETAQVVMKTETLKSSHQVQFLIEHIVIHACKEAIY